jgi:penicillin-binding protein 2
LPGVSPRQGYSRFYPSGAAVGHLIGYVGTVSAEEYQKKKDPLLITPGFKVGKDGLEKTLEDRLQGKPGAQRTEVTARGKIVRNLTTRPETPGKPVQLTIDIDLHNYAARRLGLESGSVVIFDCLTGDIITMASMPCYDPNSFSDGIGRVEWKMLNSDDHIPMLNKALQGLYPPGSTLKPVAGLAMMRHGVDPEEMVVCNGGYRLGNRVFKCLGRHGPVNMTTAIMKSCNTYFYAMGRRIGYDNIAPVARELGLGQEFSLPFPSQRYGTVPDSAWKMRKYDQQWTESDTLNAVIGQGYIIASPFQLGLMSARIASGLNIQPEILMGKRTAPGPLSFPKAHLDVVREGMNLVVNGDGTAVRSRLPLEGIAMAGKTGTAQVRRISGSQRGQSGEWKYRDHGLFVCFAPVDQPRYGAAVVIEHGMGGARAAAPIAKDVLTFIYDRERAMASLEALEAGWGGNIEKRMGAKYAMFQNQPAPPPPLDPSA